MLDWILSQNCRNTLPLHTFDQLAQNLRCYCADQLLAANVDTVAYQIEEYKNSGLAVILHCLNGFQYNNYVHYYMYSLGKTAR